MAKIHYYVDHRGLKRPFIKGVTPLCVVCAHKEQVDVVGVLSYWCRKLDGWRRRYRCKWFNGVLVTTKN